jgi:hypothetical protein
MRELREAHRADRLNSYLNSIGMKDLVPAKEKPLYDSHPEGKIVLVGACKLSEREILGCFNALGIHKDRVVLKLGYEEAKQVSFRNMHYNASYRLILCGPMPHSGVGKEDKSSIIAKLESDPGYPKVVRLTDANGLKISKTALKKALEREIRDGYLAV